ncbi:MULTISPECIES: lysophospholipid acyltransferase family protein [unclassified Lysobacter]|uniref:lysophospholipid acyltransferase family protein n=1 Tax=unclassified Lysobacter TaxID=2635362 RepID=UPI0006F95668|nr:MULTISPECIES: lysophospholipid acyltransferase family protein [unclassified Lysobacter]KRA16833.1 acyltransferase [Lysobacter sp. Root604]KRD28587.1 acyltransferase [Lysobacter sp. Root916]KRD73453.1 acyltransferase [Lysobacter sp. Root983]
MPTTADDVVLPLPPNAPRVRSNRLTRWIGRSVLRLGGWRMVGAFPDIPKLVLIGAPHSSNWDGVWGFAAKAAMGLDIKILGKDSLFKVPLLGALLRYLGVIPVDRSAAHGVVEQAAAMIRNAERFWFGLAPEGTRKPVDRWKAGFWKIAKAADVPVLPAYFHYPDKVIGIGEPFWLGEDMNADLARIRAWYRPWQGKHHGTP